MNQLNKKYLSYDRDQLIDTVRRLYQILDMIPQMIFTKDQHSRYTLVNAEVAKLFGQPIESILGKTDQELNCFPNDQQRFMEEDHEVFDTGNDVLIPEEALQQKTNSILRWYHTWKRPLKNSVGQIEEVLGIGIDITERRRAEQALLSILAGTASKTAEDYFRSLTFHLADVLGVKFAFISRLDANHETATTLAVRYNGKFIENSSYNLKNSPTEEILKSGFKLYPSGVGEIFSNDSHLIENKIVSYMGATICDSTGQALGVLSVMDDKPLPPWAPAEYIMRIFASRAGAELERLEKELAYRELQEHLLQAQKLEAVGRLAAGIAHDLNNALSAVVGHLEILTIDKNLETKAKKSIAIALEGCHRASGLIEQLLGFSRQGKYVLTKVSLQNITNNTLEFLSSVIPRNIQVKNDYQELPLYIEVDAGQMQQALTNIIINACQAMPDGGTLTIACQRSNQPRANLHNSMAQPGNFACLTVSDTGIGISNDNINRVFDPFYTTKSDSKGTGLGLAMVYGTMQNHGGWVSIDSEINKGTICRLYLPEALNAPTKMETPEIIEVNLQDRHILFIDDEPSLVDLGLQFADHFGFKASGFNDPVLALNWYQEHYNDIDLVVLDMKMPGFSGKQCFEKFRQVNSKSKIVLLSGYSQDNSIQILLEQGALKFFQKPVKYSELFAWISDFLASNKTKAGEN